MFHSTFSACNNNKNYILRVYIKYEIFKYYNLIPNITLVWIFTFIFFYRNIPLFFFLKMKVFYKHIKTLEILTESMSEKLNFISLNLVTRNLDIMYLIGIVSIKCWIKNIIFHVSISHFLVLFNYLYKCLKYDLDN